MLSRLLAATIVLPLLLRFRLRPGHRVFKRMAELLSLLPGNLGLRARSRFYAGTLTHCGERVEFGFGTVLHYPDISLGNDVSFGSHCTVGLADFGDFAIVSSYCHFLSGGNIHRFNDLSTPIRQQKAVRTRIQVGRDVWVGVGAIVMATIEEGSIVGAGAVVTRPVGPRQIVAGNPARTIRRRESSPAQCTVGAATSPPC